MPNPFPSADTVHPVTLPDGTPHTGTVFLSAVLTHPNIRVGDFTYYSDFDPPDDPATLAERLAPYLFAGAPEQLILGRFCQISQGVRFITDSANHRYDGISSFPFPIFDCTTIGSYAATFQSRRDTVVGNDVWIGSGATILPGAKIGNGAIIGAGAVVGGNVPDFAVVAGNPGRVLRLRFAPDEIDRLRRLAWWDWPIEFIATHAAVIMDGDIGALEALADRTGAAKRAPPDEPRKTPCR